MHLEAFYIPILFQHISNNGVDKFTACSVLHLSFSRIFCKYFVPSRLLFQNSLDKLENKKNIRKNKITPHPKNMMSKTYIIMRRNIQKTPPLWLVKNCHQHADFLGGSECNHRCAVFWETSEKHHYPTSVMIVTRCLCMMMQESLKRGNTSFSKTHFTSDFIN